MAGTILSAREAIRTLGDAVVLSVHKHSYTFLTRAYTVLIIILQGKVFRTRLHIQTGLVICIFEKDSGARGTDNAYSTILVLYRALFAGAPTVHDLLVISALKNARLSVQAHHHPRVCADVHEVSPDLIRR